MFAVRIDTERFFLRELSVNDATPRYLSWLRDEAASRFITSAADTLALDDLRNYIAIRAGRDDVLFLGIFDRATAAHVGNIKYEPLDAAAGYTVMGILIGDPAYRGRGVAAEVLRATARWLAEHRGIRRIELGVDEANLPAIRAYEKLGFVRAATPHIPQPAPGIATMVWTL